MIVDAHHHLWDPARAEYPWMTGALAPLRRRFGAEDLEPLLRERGVDGTVVVQARASLDETRELVAAAERVPWLLGVVGWVDLTGPDVDRQLDGLAGARHQVHDEDDPDWLLRPDVQRGVAAVGRAGIAYDLLVRTRELPAALDVARRWPETRFVVDHLAKPPLRSGDTGLWAQRLAAVARQPNVSCKLSGLVTEADWESWRADRLVPYLRRALEWFGPERCLFGSDWPVCLLAADYDAVLDLVLAALDDCDSAERAAVLGGNAVRVYGLLGVSRPV